MAGKSRFFSIALRHFFAALIVACCIFPAITQGEAKESQKDAVRGIAGSNESEAGLNHVVLQLTWLNQFQFAGYYAAVQKGFYKDAGFKVTIVEGSSERRPVEEVNAGRANYGVARAELLLHRLKGKPVVALATIFQHSAVILLAKKESDIDNPHEMIGKRVMLLEGDDAAEYIAMFQNEGISLEQIKVIASTFNIDDLVDGKTDVFNAYETNEPYYLERKGIPVSIISPRTYGIDFYGDCLFTSEREIEAHPDQVKAFRQASLRGWEYALSHPEEIIDVILAKYGVKKTRDHLSFEAEAIRKLMLPDLIEIGHMNPGRWRHIADTYVELGMADSSYSLKGFIYNPNPMPDYTWVRRALGATVSIGLLITLGFFVLLLFNRKLQVEVAQRRQTEEALQRERDTAQRYLDLAGVVFVAINKKGEVTLINRKGCKVLGYNEEEIVGKNWFENFIPEWLKKDLIPVSKKLLSGEVESAEYHENPVLTKTGEEKMIAWHNSVLKDGEGNIIGHLSSGEDITERKQAEEEKKNLEAQLQEAKKMEAIATLAGGIAHQFNNALSPIISSLDLLEMDSADDENIANYIKPMRGSAQRMAQLTNQLLAYARGGKYQVRTLSLSYFVRDTLPVIRHAVDPAIHIDTDLPSDILSVKADLTQMQMVLSAILTNASEAMEGKGRIRVTCRNEAIMDETITDFPDFNPGDYVKITIEDDGKGMDEETRNRIFEPFFTTKLQGRGLGMAASYGIIKNHDGWISVDSELGKGTTVNIYLPAVETPVKESKKPKIEPTKGTGTILLIEDEKMIMDVTRAILERLGYRVLEAKTGKEAISVAKTFDGDIDLAILDIVLPDMDGKSIYPLIMEARPILKVLVCSGYSIDGPAQEILNAGAEDFIQKPFTIVDLSEKLKKVL